MNKFLKKKAGTLEDIKESGKKLWDNMDGAGTAISTGIGGLTGYLVDQATREQDASLLRSLLYTGGGAAAGLGIYGLAKALSANKPIFNPDKETPDLVESPGWIAPLAGLAIGRTMHNKGIAFGKAAKLRRAMARRAKELKGGKISLDQDPAYSRAKAELAGIEAGSPWARGWRDTASQIKSSVQTNGLRGAVRNLRAQGLKGTLSALKGYGVRGWMPPASMTTAGLIAATALASSPYLRQKVADWTVDF